jgi:hypothetical protein
MFGLRRVFIEFRMGREVESERSQFSLGTPHSPVTMFFEVLPPVFLNERLDPPPPPA